MSYTETADEKRRTHPDIDADLSHFAGTDIVGFLELECFMYNCLLALDYGKWRDVFFYVCKTCRGDLFSKGLKHFVGSEDVHGREQKWSLTKQSRLNRSGTLSLTLDQNVWGKNGPVHP